MSIGEVIALLEKIIKELIAMLTAYFESNEDAEGAEGEEAVQ